MIEIKADTWPQMLNDTAARRDWQWNHHYDLNRLCKIMFVKLSQFKGYSKHIDQNALNDAIEKEQSGHIKYEQSTTASSTINEKVRHILQAAN